MKAQFKYAFLSGLYIRGHVFAVIFIMNGIFILLGSLDLLPFAAKVTSVALCGVAIAVMMASNIIGDIAIARCMFSAPRAYLYALTPAPRWKNLLAAVTAMSVMDIVSMFVVITSQVWLSLNLAGREFLRSTWELIRNSPHAPNSTFILLSFLLLIAGYFLAIMLILFCVTAQKSVFYKKPASWLLTFLLACACIYVINLLHIILAPFGEVHSYAMFMVISLSTSVLPVYIVFIVLITAGLFVLTSKLMEKRMNI